MSDAHDNCQLIKRRGEESTERFKSVVSAVFNSGSDEAHQIRQNAFSVVQHTHFSALFAGCALCNVFLSQLERDQCSLEEGSGCGGRCIDD